MYRSTGYEQYLVMYAIIAYIALMYRTVRERGKSRKKRGMTDTEVAREKEGKEKGSMHRSQHVEATARGT